MPGAGIVTARIWRQQDCETGPERLHGAMLRILSDLHLHDARTGVRELRQVEPLLVGVRTLVLNGDTCEARHDVTPTQVEELKAFFRRHVPEVVFLTGNHDPDISDRHDYLAAEGRVWVTHGDACLDDLTPWARHLGEMRRLAAEAREAEPAATRHGVDARLRVARAVARRETHFPDRTTRHWRAHLAWVWHTFFPPRQTFALLRSWRELPVAAAALARADRPTAQVVVTGHVHLPGVWRTEGGPVVVNTGSFFRPLGGNLVDIEGDLVRVRRISSRGGQFHPGRIRHEIALR